jgi:hypothetical protein
MGPQFPSLESGHSASLTLQELWGKGAVSKACSEPRGSLSVGTGALH